jgi:glycosyltransferase involved in cell wall biosynthesis
MRIAQVVPARAHPWSGVPVVAVHLAVHLARRGHHVEVWLLQPWSEQERAVHAGALGDAGVRLVAPTAAGLRRRLAALAERDVDLAQLHSVFTPPNALLARRLRIPYVVSPHGGYAPASLARNATRKAVYKHLVERRMLRRAALRVALTEVEARDLAAFGAGEPVTVIPNGVAPAPDAVDGAAFRRELELGPHDRLLLFVGRLDVRHKGLDLLLRGAAEAPGWHLALLGPDHRGGGTWLRDQARRLGMPERLAVVGPRHGRRLHEAFAAADCFALTSRWEGLPIALLEALAHGVPPLVSPAVDRLLGVTDAGAGWVAAPAELGAVLRRLERLDGQERARRAAAARALAARYDWAEVAARYEAAYAGLLPGATRRGGHQSDSE